MDIDNMGDSERSNRGASIRLRVDIMCLRYWGVVVEEVMGSSSCWILSKDAVYRVR